MTGLAVMLVPAVAQAHYVSDQKSTATCDLVNGVPTITFKIEFEEFIADDMPVTGKITLDRDTYNVPELPRWTGSYTYVWTKATTAGPHTVQGDFTWPTKGSNNGTTVKTVNCPKPVAIDVEKTAVESTAVAGSTVHFTIAVTNPASGSSYVSYVFDDPNCDEVRTGDNASDTKLDPGETWTYSCAMATAVGQTSADNTATATGTNCENNSATDSDSASIPLTQPGGGTPPAGGTTPPAGVTTPPAGGTTPPAGGTTPPAGGTLPDTAASGRARLRGPSGCVKRAFRARVTGRSITSVAFFVDGKLVKRFTSNRSSYSIKVKPRGLGFGRHRIVARVKFVRGSGTEARNLPLTFRRCARAQVTPQFTG